MTLRAAAEQFTTIANVRASETCACVTEATPSDSDLSDLIDEASDTLCILSGGRVFGRREITIYPCRTASTYPTCGCGCGLDSIPLGDLDPTVSEVKIDGTALGASEYELHRDRMGFQLVRVADDLRPNAWPSSQSLWRPNTADDTFSITYTHGVNIGYVARRACEEVVCGFVQDDLKASNQLSRGTVSADVGGARLALRSQGTREERVERMQAGDTGPAVARFMSIYAPRGRQSSEVYAPEIETWTFVQKT